MREMDWIKETRKGKITCTLTHKRKNKKAMKQILFYIFPLWFDTWYILSSLFYPLSPPKKKFKLVIERMIWGSELV